MSLPSFVRPSLPFLSLPPLHSFHLCLSHSLHCLSPLLIQPSFHFPIYSSSSVFLPPLILLFRRSVIEGTTCFIAWNGMQFFISLPPFLQCRVGGRVALSGSFRTLYNVYGPCWHSLSLHLFLPPSLLPRGSLLPSSASQFGFFPYGFSTFAPSL